jgi:hypothetical protein
MHAWEGNPRLDESAEYRTEAFTVERSRTKPMAPHTVNWKVAAGLAAGALLGVPFVATGTVHAAWAQLSHMFAFFRR